MKRVLERLEEIQIAVLKTEIEMAMCNFSNSSSEDICELRYMLERVNREIMKIENIALVKLYKVKMTEDDIVEELPK